MEIKNAIVARRSVRSYTGEPLRESVFDGLVEFVSEIKPLHDNIPVDIEIYSREDFANDFSRAALYRANDFVVIRSAKTAKGYLQNAGFIGEQIILWLTHIGIGSCWVGMAKQKKHPARGELPYVVAIEFGRADNTPFRRKPEDSPRMRLHEVMLNRISRPAFLKVLDAGRLAPSVLNWQPVRYFSVDDNLYICRKPPPMKSKKLDEMQQIDVGAAMANMFVACDGACVFVRQNAPPEPPDKKCIYEYTMKLIHNS